MKQETGESRSLSWGEHSKREASLLPELLLLPVLWLGREEESRAQQTESLLEGGVLESWHWQELHIRVWDRFCFLSGFHAYWQDNLTLFLTVRAHNLSGSLSYISQWELQRAHNGITLPPLLNLRQSFLLLFEWHCRLWFSATSSEPCEADTLALLIQPLEPFRSIQTHHMGTVQAGSSACTLPSPFSPGQQKITIHALHPQRSLSRPPASTATLGTQLADHLAWLL